MVSDVVYCIKTASRMIIFLQAPNACAGPGAGPSTMAARSTRSVAAVAQT